MEGKVLMPCKAGRARKLMERGEATGYWNQGIFCIRLNRPPRGVHTQPVVASVDPGSKREGFAVKSAAHDYLFVDADAKTWVGKKVGDRAVLRQGRRGRKTPCRSPRREEDGKRKPPAGTRARWEWKLRMVQWLASMFPVRTVVVEDVKATTKPGQRGWNEEFSPLEVGKQWMYARLRKRWDLVLRQGWETAAVREELGLRKTKRKTAEKWEAHCVDAWVIARDVVGGAWAPEHRDIVRITPIQRQRRCLHRANPGKGGVRQPYGGTQKLGIKTGTLVHHPKYGLCYTGGTSKGKLSLHNRKTGKRITQGAKKGELKVLKSISWRTRLLPRLKAGVSDGTKI